MAALATQADLIARIGPLTATQIARADALLADASAYVRDDTSQQFEQVAAETIVLRPIGSQLRLPKRPVTAVTSVEALGRPPQADVALAVNAWAWDGLDRIELDVGRELETVTGEVGTWHWDGTNTFRVTYAHGPAAIPDIVVAVVCEMVNRVLTSPSLASGLTQETIGQFGHQFQQATGSQGTAVRYTDNDRLKLRRYRRTSATVKTPIR